jgi:hypothetical protein
MARKRGPRLSIIPAWAVTDPRIDSNALRVLALLGRHLDDDGWCRRSQTKMAAELACSRSSVQRGIEVLCGVGCVEVRLGARPGCEADPEKQPFAAHYYRVILDPPDADGGEVPAGGRPPVPSMVGHPVPAYERAPIYERSSDNDISDNPPVPEQPSPKHPSTTPLESRAGMLDRLFGPIDLQNWFEGCHFREGPPLTIVLAKRFKRDWVRNKWSDRLRRAFGEELSFDYAR